MWALIAPYLIKVGVSLAITLLEKTGVITSFEADGIKAGTHVIQAVENLKSYAEYPTGRNGGTAPN